MIEKAWVLILGAATLAGAQSGNDPIPTECLVADIVVLADVSGSVEEEMQFVRDGTAALTERFVLSETGVKIGLAVFDASAYELYPIGSDRDVLLPKLRDVRTYDDSKTDIVAALKLAKAMFDATPIRTETPRFLVLISDGADNSGNDRAAMVAAAAELKKIGVGIFTIFTGAYFDFRMPGDPPTGRPRSQLPKHSDWDKFVENMRAIASPGAYLEINYDSLVQALDDLRFCG